MVALLAGLLLLVISLQNTHTSSTTEKPHIIIIMADDLGWNDVSFHGSDQIPTPNIDALAYNGVILNSHYVPALCTPSRASLLTGKYPTTLGMQHLVILAQEPWGLPLKEKLLPEYLRQNGYRTHAVGKWHLGFHQKSYTPLNRGFDTFYGYYNGYHDYFQHTMEASDQDIPQKGYDMRRGLDIDYEAAGKYSTDLFTEEAVKLIHKHDNAQGPMFLYLAHLAPHSGNDDAPYQAPDEDIARFSYIRDPQRRVYAAMVHRMDEGVGRVVAALRSTGKLENSIILFMSDNGAVTFGVHSNHGSNYPLRGLKESPWEGGVRGVAALWSPLLNKTRRVSNQIMHTADWLPTLLSAAGLKHELNRAIDGMDIWRELSDNLPSPRTEVFNNYDEIEDYSSLRLGNWKYISGTAQEGEVDDWYGDTGEEDDPPAYDTTAVFSSDAGVSLTGYTTQQQLLCYPNCRDVHDLLTTKEIRELRQSSQLSCSATRRSPLAFIDPSWSRSNETFSNSTVDNAIHLDIISKLQHITINDKVFSRLQTSNMGDFACDPRRTPCLFHLGEDPCEEYNFAHLFPEVLERLESRLLELKKTVHPPLNVPGDPMANPALHGGVWTHWQDVPESRFSSLPLLSLLFEPLTRSLPNDYVVLSILTIPLNLGCTIVQQASWGLAILTLSIMYLKIYKSYQAGKYKIVS